MLADRNPCRRTMGEFTEEFPIRQEDRENPINPMHRYHHLQKPQDSYYRCSHCKYPLAPANSTFTLSEKTHDSMQFESCTHVFLSNPMSWMQLDTSSPGGKLLCPNCPAHIGEYCWLGVQCACGEIVSPGLALIRQFDEDVLSGVEFRVVSEGSVDYYEAFSSKETSQEADDDEEEEEMDRNEDFRETFPESQELDEAVERVMEPDDTQDSENIPERTVLSIHAHDQGQISSQGTLPSDQRAIPRSVPMIGRSEKSI